MSIVAAFDKTLFYNEASRYAVLQMKTADIMIPQEARKPYRYHDHLIRFTAVGYDLPRTNAVKMALEGNWSKGNMVASFKWSIGARSSRPLWRASAATSPPAY